MAVGIVGVMWWWWRAWWRDCVGGRGACGLRKGLICFCGSVRLGVLVVVVGG